MDNIIAKAGRTVTGVACGLIAAELVAIGANAAVDDIVYLVEKVNNVMARDYEGDLYHINVLYSLDNIICTPNHKFYVVNKKDKELITDVNYKEYAFWVEAEDLTEEHLLINLYQLIE